MTRAFKNTPVPITLPITTAVAVSNPSPRTRLVLVVSGTVMATSLLYPDGAGACLGTRLPIISPGCSYVHDDRPQSAHRAGGAGRYAGNCRGAVCARQDRQRGGEARARAADVRAPGRHRPDRHARGVLFPAGHPGHAERVHR